MHHVKEVHAACPLCGRPKRPRAAGHPGCAVDWPSARQAIETAGGRIVGGPRFVDGEWWALVEFPTPEAVEAAKAAGVTLYRVRWPVWAI